MQSVESSSTQTSRDCLTFGDDDSEIFLSEDEKSGDHSSSASSSSSSLLGWSGTDREREKDDRSDGSTQRDQLFAQKCFELQGFIRPLLELLHGLKKGRFDRGLSSFQQSLAMDRIQRIVGVLQKPHIGEKYLPTLLQVEMMLKLWFPHVSITSTGTCKSTQLYVQGSNSSSSSSSSSCSSTPPHKQRDQLHIPVKKRRLSWSDTDSSATPTPVACKCFHIKGQEKEEQSEGLSLSCTPTSHADQSDKSSEKTSGPKGVCWAEPGMTWVHVAPILSPPKSCPTLREGGDKDITNGHFHLAPPLLSSRGSPATQDNSISSTTPCSEPVTVTLSEGRSLSPPITEHLSSLLQS
ncbi:circadian associated repressor of transcription a [Tachysurus fulvidraco]|uniref:circadian associated repressor of transcription a n=1 Tax=Tachysurus fulvidraco TaxID=1234273 RepID=UPI001FEDB9F0|nr:circadian associated repressor of transcription a [Tachysurus fulvidraco]